MPKDQVWLKFCRIMTFNFNEDHEWEWRMRNLVAVMLPQPYDGRPNR